jgi:hypothetical protein
MSFASNNPYASSMSQAVAYSGETERTTFLRRTYGHLLAAVTAFVLLEMAIFTLIPQGTLDGLMQQLAQTPYSWLIVLGAFMGVSWIANSWAQSGSSLGLQYAGLGLYVVAEAVIFVPLLYIAQRFEGAIPTAAIMTLIMFGGLTTMVLVTRADFSWMGRYLFLAGIGAMGIVVCAVLFNFSLGIFFSGAMVVLACGYIMFYTSNVMHHYRTDQYVAAALALFAAVALLFYYVLRIVMSFGRE